MSNMQRINIVNKLHSQLQKTTNVEDRIKLHQAAIKMIEGRENEDPEDGDIVQRNNEFGGIQSIPLLTTNSRGPTLSSFEPSTTEGGITSSTSTESLHRQRRVRRHSVSSESLTSSTGHSRESASRNASISRIPAIIRERLTPDAEKRVFNWNYRGPIPTKHHCQRSLFGKHVDVTPEPVETPKRRSQSKNRTPLRQNPEIPRYDHRPGMHLHESSCDAARKLQASKSTTNVSSIPWNSDYRKTPPRVNKGSHENLFQSSAKKRLDAWQPIERSKSSHSVKPITSSTPKKHTEEDSDGYAIPSVPENDPALLNKTRVRREVTPPELYQTPSVNLNLEGSGNDSFESAKEFQTPIKKNIRRRGSVLPKESLQDETEAEIAAIDTVLAKVSPARSKIPKFIPRAINLTPSTDYRNLKDTSVEKNFEEVQAAIKSKSKDKMDSFAIHPGSKDKATGDITSSVFSTSPAAILKSATTQNESTLNANVTPLSTTVDDIQTLRLFSRYNFDTPKTSETTNKNETELTPNTKFRTSLSRETLIKSFKEALDINITAKKRFLKYERQYYEKVRDWKKIERIEKELEKFPNVVKTAMEHVKTVTQDCTEKAWRKVLSETEKLQNDATEFVKLTNENKEKRRRKSLNFGYALFY
uniref:Uncharacterized protein n=1 Tax=Panagrolaimus sp. PS1159 TaxID=55785 RepID=A0AC35GKT0_9BILA